LLRANLDPNSGDETGALVAHCRAELQKLLPPTWFDMSIADGHLEEIAQENALADELVAIRGVTICGSKQDNVWAGLENFSIPSLRLQAWLPAGLVEN
jgi:hypothetical protein